MEPVAESRTRMCRTLTYVRRRRRRNLTRAYLIHIMCLSVPDRSHALADLYNVFVVALLYNDNYAEDGDMHCEAILQCSAGTVGTSDAQCGSARSKSMWYLG